MFEVVFLVVLGLIGIISAIIQDFKKREVANWLNFSIIIFALGFRFFWSLFSGFDSGENFAFFYQGLIGLGIFFVLGNIFYYGRVFAGGDAKLMIALGTILPMSLTFRENLKIYGIFILLFLISGAIYGLISSLIIALRHRKEFDKEFKKQFSKRKKLVYLSLMLGIILLLASFYFEIFFLLGIFIFVFPYVYLFAKSVDEACMIKLVSPENLTEGDWLYKDVKISRGKIIKANWDGVQADDIKSLRKSKKKILIRIGIPFTPVFLIAFLIFIYFLVR